MLEPLVLAVAAASVTSAHFILQWPPTAGFFDDGEPTVPCGTANVTFNSSTPSIQVDQFAISILNVHPTGEWMIRGTTDTQDPYHFTDIVPIVNTTGQGTFCLTGIKAPSNFAGKSGVIQVIDNSPDGILYQLTSFLCAAVNWISGSNSSVGETCSNVTGFAAQFTNQQDFVTDQGNASTTASASPSMSMSAAASGAASASAAASSTSKAAAAPAMATGVGALTGGVVLGMALLAL